MKYITLWVLSRPSIWNSSVGVKFMFVQALMLLHCTVTVCVSACSQYDQATAFQKPDYIFLASFKAEQVFFSKTNLITFNRPSIQGKT